MKTFAWLSSRLIAAVIGAVIGAAIGATITGVKADRIFQKQLQANQYSIFAEDIQSAVRSHRMWRAVENDDARKNELQEEVKLYLMIAWARALVALPDEAFLEIDKMVKRGTMNIESRNRVYHILRKQLYPDTSIKYDDIMTVDIGLQE